MRIWVLILLRHFSEKICIDSFAIGQKAWYISRCRREHHDDESRKNRTTSRFSGLKAKLETVGEGNGE